MAYRCSTRLRVHRHGRQAAGLRRPLGQRPGTGVRAARRPTVTALRRAGHGVRSIRGHRRARALAPRPHQNLVAAQWRVRDLALRRVTIYILSVLTGAAPRTRPSRLERESAELREPLVSVEASDLVTVPRAELDALKAELRRLRREVGRGVARGRIQVDPGPGDDAPAFTREDLATAWGISE
jgi:hypothetical protein